MMAWWTLLALMVLMLDRVLVVPGTPIPAFQILSQNCPKTAPYSTALESPQLPTTGPSASWSYPKAEALRGPRITFSLDVPIGLLRILLEQARTKAAREQAATNARILAHVGRR